MIWGLMTVIFHDKLSRRSDERERPMQEYFFRPATAEDCQGIVAVYNSNQLFLLDHLGQESIDEKFVTAELKNMQRAGFLSLVIVEQKSGAIQGVLDYRPDKEVYLSLLMLTAELQGKGLGRRIYRDFEKEMDHMRHASIRIDVVADRKGNAMHFWKSLGFVEMDKVTLHWGNQKNQAIMMKKNLDAKV